jgi:hypothetical protein
MSISVVFPPNLLSPAVLALLNRPRLPELGPGREVREVQAQLAGLDLPDLFANGEVKNTDAASACLSGLWLWFDFLDQSHTISQDLHTSDGSYWHAIMHRREPDYGNSKYWWRRVGSHPVFDRVSERAQQLATEMAASGPAAWLAEQHSWDPYRFVDLCQQAASGEPELDDLCRQVQAAEWQELFIHCGRAATGTAA